MVKDGDKPQKQAIAICFSKWRGESIKAGIETMLATRVRCSKCKKEKLLCSKRRFSWCEACDHLMTFVETVELKNVTPEQLMAIEDFEAELDKDLVFRYVLAPVTDCQETYEDIDLGKGVTMIRGRKDAAGEMFTQAFQFVKTEGWDEHAAEVWMQMNSDIVREEFAQKLTNVRPTLRKALNFDLRLCADWRNFYIANLWDSPNAKAWDAFKAKYEKDATEQWILKPTK
jgi:hypothetical protein